MLSKGELICLACGLVGHASFLFFASTVPEPPYNPSDRLMLYTEVELEPITMDKEHPEPLPKEEDRTEHEVASLDHRETSDNPHIGALSHNGTARGTSSNDSTNGGPGSSTGDNSEPNGHGPDEYENSDNGSWSIPIGPGGRPIWAIKGVINWETEGKAARTDTDKTAPISRDKANELLQADMHERDKKIGMTLPAAGTVATLAKEAVWSSGTPDKSQATIAVVIAPDGTVSSVRVAGFAGGTSADWEGIAANIKASLAARHLNLTEEYKHGALVTVNLKSKMQNPSGTDPDHPVDFGTTTKFDISDLGAKPIRQVTSQVNVTALKGEAN